AVDLARHGQITRMLTALRQEESELLLTSNESSKRVQQVRQKMADLEDQITKRNIDPLYLASLNATAYANAPASPRYDWMAARAAIVALEAKYQLLTNRLAGVRENIAKLDAVENSIAELELRRKNEEEAYAYYMRELDEIRVDQTR